MDYSKFNFENLVIENEKVTNFFVFVMSAFGVRKEVFLTIARKKKSLSFLYGNSSIPVIAEAIGFTEPNQKALAVYYGRKDDLRSKVGLIASIFFTFFSFLVVFLGVAYIAFLLDLQIELNPVPASLLLLVMSYLIMAISFRIFLLLFEKHFIETICIASVFHIILFLHRDNVISRPDRKKILLIMIEYLARRITLLGIAYRNRSFGNDGWTQNHFNYLSQYVRERAKWVIAPTPNTLGDIRNDFYDLAKTLLEGTFGDLRWDTDNNQKEFSSKKQTSFWITIGNKLIRFIGYMMPTILIAFYLWKPDFFPIISIDTETATTILIAWLLLSIDIGFNLGIVSSVIRFATDIRDLSKG